jgi:outer membrane murein-binding lipoprotein Lpp
MKVKNIILSVAFVLTSLMLFSGCSESSPKDKAATAKKDTAKKVAAAAKEDTVAAPVVYPPVDKKLYDSLMKKLANGDTTGKWPVKKAPYPLPGAILPFKRVIAYYGNLSAK